MQSWHFVLSKEWTFRAIMAVFLSHDERFLLSWFALFFFVNERTFRAIMFLFLLFCCGQTITFSCNHDFVFSFLVNEWTVCAIMTFVFVLSKNELFVVSWLCCCQRMNFSCNHDFVLFSFWSMNEHFVLSWHFLYFYK